MEERSVLARFVQLTDIQNNTFFKWSSGFVSCNRLFRDKSLYQYTKHVYVQSSSNSEILKVEIEEHALYDNKSYSAQGHWIKKISFRFKNKLSYEINNFVQGLLLLDARFEKLCHVFI